MGNSISIEGQAPLPFSVVCAIAMQLLWMGQIRCALGVLLAFTAYLRLGEMTDISFRQLLPPGPQQDEGGRWWVLLLNPSGEGPSSKTGRYDDSIVLNDPRFAAMYDQFRRLKKRHGPQEKLIGMSHAEFTLQFNTAVEGLPLSSIGKPVTYQLRHAGASDDRINERLSLAEVKKRGRWLADKSVYRYEKGSRTRDQLLKLSAGTQDHCLRCQALLDAVVGRRRGPLPPPIVR